jgi:hypothetical protein
LKVAAYFQKHFVAAYQQVGSFEVVDQHGKLQRNGGNVASYFCTPEGRVIHAATGPIGADELLEYARWAVDAYAGVPTGQNANAAELVAQAHRTAPAERVNGHTSNDRAIHQLLANKPLPALAEVYREIFEKILGQRVSLPGNSLDAVSDAVASARQRQLPVLFILHKDRRDTATMATWDDVSKPDPAHPESPLPGLAEQYVVIGLPLNLLPACSERLGIRPYAAPDTASPLFVVARPDGKQLAAVTTWNKSDELARIMAQGLVHVAKEEPRSPQQLTQLLSLVTPVDRRLADDVQHLIAQPRFKSPSPLDLSDKVASRDRGLTKVGKLNLKPVRNSR